MATATKKRPQKRDLRDLFEQILGTQKAPLKIDKEKGIIFRVKVLGRFSPNNHNMPEAENGTEYSRRAMESERPLLEGRKVKCNHPANRLDPSKERPIEDTFGVLRNVIIESDESGEPTIWADLHCLTSHPMYPRVVEDVEKGLGVYGLSHNAAASKERFDTANRRLVIEEIGIVRSVDLVDKPATNRNLWESEEPMATKSITYRSLLEARLTKLSKPRQSWARWLLEDDMGMGTMADTATDVPEEGDEEDALWSGFQAAIQKVLDSYKAGECDAKEAGKKIMDWLKAHDKLTGDEEPEGVEESEEYCDPEKKDKGKMESEELERLRKEKKVRQLCESQKFTPDELQVESLCGLSDDTKRKAMIESFKGKPSSRFQKPQSGLKKAPPKDGGRQVTESEEDGNVADDLAALRN